jgi:hypothetical protein
MNAQLTLMKECMNRTNSQVEYFIKFYQILTGLGGTKNV